MSAIFLKVVQKCQNGFHLLLILDRKVANLFVDTNLVLTKNDDEDELFNLLNAIFLYIVLTIFFLFLSALEVLDKSGEAGPLQPKHLREALRRLRVRGAIPTRKAHKSMFRL